jgi:hypothetical protein
MALKKPTASEAMKQAFVNGLADFAALGDAAPGDAAPGGVGEAKVWQIFNVGLPDLAGDVGIKNAKAVAWRFHATDASGAPIACELPETTPDRALMTHLSHGPRIAEALQAAAQLETLPQVKAAEFDLLTLRIPGILVEAFWLKSRGGGTDLVVPYITRSKQLQLGRPYSMNEFLSIVRPIAAKRLAYDDGSPIGAGS